MYEAVFPELTCRRAPPGRWLAALFVLLASAAAASASQSGDACARADDPAALYIRGEQASDVVAFGQSVVVEGVLRQGVVALGGDVIVRGEVEGDAGAVGGSVWLCGGARVGGDVIILGGAYYQAADAGARRPASNTLMFAGYERELRELARNPASLLRPRFSASYVSLRFLSVLFWLIVSLAFTAISPGAVGRAAARLQLTSPRVALIGLLGAAVAGPGVVVSLRYLPPTLGAVVLTLALLLLLVAYLFGRVAIHAATGRWLQRVLLPEKNRSEVVALLLGAVFWSLALALPFVWPLLVGGLLVTSLGLALTARYRVNWKRS